MLFSQICTKLFFILLLQIFQWFWLAGSSCLYPGHRTNEMVVFSDSLKNNSYPESTVATYFCENGLPEIGFKEAVCQSNGTWTWTWTGQVVNCSLFYSNKCQRRMKWVNSTPLNTLLFQSTCFTFQRGIHMSMLENLTNNCDITAYHEDKLGYSKFFNTEVTTMCNIFVAPDEPHNSVRKILFAMTPKRLDLSWYEKVAYFFKYASLSRESPPSCMYLYCYLNPREGKIIIENCDREQQYWICKHDLSSCGIPSQTMNSEMNYTGIFVNDVATYKCPLGYAMDTLHKRQCQSNGRWSGIAPRCRLVNCGPPPDLPENVTYVLLQGKTTYRNWLQHKCLLDGHNITRESEYRMCQANGQWSKEAPICELFENEEIFLSDSSYSGLHPDEKDLLKVIVGIIAGITFSLILIMWLILAAVTYRHKRREMEGYSSQK